MKVGLIGLVNMGQAMACNLSKFSHRVIVYSQIRSCAEELKAGGAIGQLLQIHRLTSRPQEYRRCLDRIS